MKKPSLRPQRKVPSLAAVAGAYALSVAVPNVLAQQANVRAAEQGESARNSADPLLRKLAEINRGHLSVIPKRGLAERTLEELTPDDVVRNEMVDGRVLEITQDDRGYFRALFEGHQFILGQNEDQLEVNLDELRISIEEERQQVTELIGGDQLAMR